MNRFMSDRNLQSAQARLAQCARTDARRLTPGFSDCLHARVTRAIAATELPALRIHRAAGNRPAVRHWIAPLVMAAAVALLVVPTMLPTQKPFERAIVQPASEPIDPPAAPDAHKPQLAVYSTAHEVNTQVQDVVETAMAREQFAGLDHDVRAATQFLVDQVPLRSAWDSDASSPTR
jgi:hypothetical protein